MFAELDCCSRCRRRCFFFDDAAPTQIYTLSLHDALPISCEKPRSILIEGRATFTIAMSSTTMNCTAQRSASASHFRSPEPTRSEEHTSELQSRLHLVCRLLLEKKKKRKQRNRKTWKSIR